MKRRNVIKNLAGLSLLGPMLGSPAIAGASKDDQSPILVVLELSGGNDGLNTVVPYADDNYYTAAPDHWHTPVAAAGAGRSLRLQPGIAGHSKAVAKRRTGADPRLRLRRSDLFAL